MNQEMSVKGSYAFNVWAAAPGSDIRLWVESRAFTELLSGAAAAIFSRDGTFSAVLETQNL